MAVDIVAGTQRAEGRSVEIDANKTNNGEQFANEQDEQTSEQPPIWLTVKEAAARLGISDRGVQMRVQRGKLLGKREGDRLLVCLDAPPEPVVDTNEQGEQNEHSRTVREQETNNLLVDHLLEEVEFLRSQLETQRADHAEQIERRDRAEGELRRLLLADREEIGRLRYRLAAVDVSSTPDGPRNDTESVQSVDTVKHTQEVSEGTQRPAGAEAGTVSNRPWWRRLWGKGSD